MAPSVRGRMKQRRVRFPRQRTFIDHSGTSALCREETHAPQQTTSLFDHPVGAGKHGRYTASVPMPTASSGPTEMGCPRYVRFTDAFLVAPHQDRRHLSEGFGESPLISRPRGRLNGARIHTLEFSKISEDLR